MRARVRPGLAGFAVIALSLSPTAPLGAQTVDAYELGMSVGVAVADAAHTLRHVDVSVPIPRLRVGVVMMDRLLLETEVAARFQTRFEGDGFGSFELMPWAVWHVGGPTERGLYLGAGAGLAYSTFEGFRGNLDWVGQPLVGARAGYKWVPAEAFVLRTGLFARRHIENDDRPWRWAIGAEVAGAILLR